MPSSSFRAALLISVALLASGCQTAAPPPVADPEHASLPPPDTLAGTTWRARMIDGAIVNGVGSTVAFIDDRRVAGVLACNRYTASYSADALGLRFTSIAATRAMCDRATMMQEERFTAVLNAARGLRFGDDGALLLLDGAGVVRAALLRSPARAAE
jgi:heat shock protein HslJ